MSRVGTVFPCLKRSLSHRQSAVRRRYNSTSSLHAYPSMSGNGPERNINPYQRIEKDGISVSHEPRVQASEMSSQKQAINEV